MPQKERFKNKKFTGGIRIHNLNTDNRINDSINSGLKLHFFYQGLAQRKVEPKIGSSSKRENGEKWVVISSL